MAKVEIKLPALWQNPAADADQYRFITSPKRIALAATGTKIGKTLGCSIWILDNAIKKPNSLWWWIAPYRKTAKIGFRRVKSLLPPGKFETNESDLVITLPHNGARMEFRTAENPDSLYGDAVNGAVVDEGGRMREAAWTAIGSTLLQTQGRIRVASNTDKGRRNWLYREFLRGKSGDPEIESFHIRTPEAPHFMEGGVPGPEAIENYRRMLSPLDFEAIVMAEFPEDAATVFPGLSKILVDAWNGIAFTDEKMPHEFMFLPDSGVFVGGLDLANRRDWTVITVMDAVSGLVVYWTRFRHTMWEEQIRRVKWVQNVFRCPFLVDATGGSVGDPMIERLQLSGVMAEPFEFKQRTKQWIIERLSIDVQEQTILIPRVIKPLIKEMEELEREVTDSGVVKYHAPDGDDSHDDAVMSLALANWMRDQIPQLGFVSGGERNPLRGGLERRGFLRG